MDRPVSPNRQPLTDVPRFSALHFRSASPPPPYTVRHHEVPPYSLPPPTMSPAAAIPPGAASFAIYSSPTSNGMSTAPTFSSSGHYPPSVTSLTGPVSARSHLHTGVSPRRSVSPFTAQSLVEPASPHSPAFGLRKDHGSVQLNELRLANMVGISEPYRAPSPRAVAPPPPPSAVQFSRIIPGAPPVLASVVPPPGLVGPNRYHTPRSSSPWGMRPEAIDTGRHSPAIPPLALHGIGVPPPPPLMPIPPPPFMPFARPASPTQHTSYLPDDLRERVQSLERQLTGLVNALTSPREYSGPAGEELADATILTGRLRSPTPESHKQRAVGLVDDSVVHLPPMYPAKKLRTRASPAYRQDETSAALYRYPVAPVATAEPEKRARRRTVVNRGAEVVHIAAPLGILAGLEAAQLREIEQNDSLMAALRRIEELEAERVKNRIEEERAKRLEAQVEKLRQRRQVSFDIPTGQQPTEDPASKPKRKRAATAFRQDFATISALLRQDEEDEAEPQVEAPLRWKRRSVVGRGAEVVHLAPATAGQTANDDWQLRLVDMAVEQQRRVEELEAEIADHKRREQRAKRIEEQAGAIKRRNTSLGLPGSPPGATPAGPPAGSAPLVKRRLTVRANPVVELTHLPPVILNDESKAAPAKAAKAVERMERAEGLMVEHIDELMQAKSTIQAMEAEVDRLKRVEGDNLRLRNEVEQARGQLEGARTNMQLAQALAQSVNNGLEDGGLQQPPAFLAASMQRSEAASQAEINRLKAALDEKQQRLMKVWEDVETRDYLIQERDRQISQLQANVRDLAAGKGGRSDSALAEENENLRNEVLHLSQELEQMQAEADYEVKHWQMELIRKCAAYDDMLQRTQM